MNNTAVWGLIITALGTLGVRQIISWYLNRGKVKVDEATAIRLELRSEIERKDKTISAHEQRISNMEESHDAREREFSKREYEFRLYKVEVYRTLIENGASPELLGKIRLLDF